ncbi:hypothetical protein JCM9279_007590 [Rhodotorula babjevae]
MDFRQLLNPSGDSQRASDDASLPPRTSTAMRLDSLLSGPEASAPLPAFADNLYTAMPEAGGFAPSAFELSPAAPPPPPPAFDPYTLLDPALLAAQVRDAMGAPQPAARGASPVSTTSLVADSDDESRRRVPGAQAVQQAVQLDEDGDVDIMGMGEGDETTPIAALKAQRRPSTTPKPRSKPSSTKPTPRPLHLSSTVTSPAPSPGPSGLSHELFHDDSALGSLTESSANPTAPPMSPSSYVHPRLNPSHPRPRLPPTFEAYRPPRRATFVADPDDTDSEEDEDARRLARSRRAQEAARKGKNRANRAKEDDEEVDDRLYCICKELYDPERMMIACDSCEEWYHIDCVNIDDEAVSLVDLFFCPRCSAVSHTNRTTWKRACARPTCRSPVAPLSKYCTDYCGIAVAAARLSLLEAERGVDPSTFWERVAGAQRREAEVVETTKAGDDVDVPALEDLPAPERAAREAELRAKAWARQDAADAALRAELVKQLHANAARAASLRDKRRLVQQRKAYLGIAVRRWEALCTATADELKREGIDVGGVDEDEAVAERKSGGRSRKGKGGAKKKGPQAPTSLPTAQCGLDVRLVLDEAAWRAWVEGEGRDMLDAEQGGDTQGATARALDNLEGVCLETRKRCDRHQGWQKLRDLDFKLEEAVLDRRVQHFDALGTTLSSRLAQHDESVAFRLAHRARTCDPDVLVPVDDFFAEQEESREERAAEEAAAATGRRRRTRSPSLRAGVDAVGASKVGDGVEVPDDVLQYLSRAQLRELKRQGRT